MSDNPSELVEIGHPDIEGTGHVPRSALERYAAKGWQTTESTPNLPADDGADTPPEASEPRPLSPKRSNA